MLRAHRTPLIVPALCALTGCSSQQRPGDFGTRPSLEAGSDDGSPFVDAPAVGPDPFDGSLASGPACASAADRHGCACVAGSAPRACTSGSGRGCVVGHQACMGTGEGATWGPCTGDAGGCVSPEAGTVVDAGPSPIYTGGCAPLSVGGEHACAITPSGGVKCWGNDVSGMRGFGNNQIPGYGEANDVLGLTSGVACIAAGAGQTCALTQAGAVKCWGDPWNGVVAGQSAWGATPVDVPGLSSGVVGLASGVFDTCALLADGSVQCWGGGADVDFATNTMYGLPPQTIPGVPSGAVAVQMSDGFGCVLTRSGTVECWGGNNFGELGNGSTFPSVPPVPVTGLGSGVASIWANGGVAACALLAGGSLKCWGTGPTPGGLLPVAVTGLPGPVKSMSAGAETACALLTDGSVYCWPDTGWPSTLGDGGASGPPTLVTGLPPAQFVAVNTGGKCALAGGKVYCWSSWWSNSSTVVEVTGF